MHHRHLLPLTAAALCLLPAGHAAAGWGADRAQTRAGDAGLVHVAAGPGDRIAVGWQRTVDRTQRAEVRLGRARDGLTRPPLLLDRSAGSLESPIATSLREGGFGVAWRRAQSGNQRIRYVTIDRAGRVSPTTSATTTGQSAFDPQWVPGPVPALLWSRETRVDAIELAPAGLRGVQRIPVAPRSEPGAVADADGLQTLSWVDDGRVLVVDREGDGFGPATTVATGDVNRTEVVRAGDATLVFWRQATDLMVAVRPAGGSFGAPRLVLAGTTDAAQVAVTSTGEVLALAPVGDASRVGELQLARLGADGASRGPVLSLGRGRRAQLTVDGRGSAFAVWMSEDATRTVTARRIATGGILGAPRVLAARSDVGSSPAIAATPEGGAVAAWVTGGDVRARTYRP